MKRVKIYWLCQIIGWLLFVLINSAFFEFKNGISKPVIVSLTSTFVLGIFLSHLFRNTIIKYDWLRGNPLKIIPKFLLMAFVISIGHHFLQALVDYVSFNTSRDWFNNRLDLIAGVLNVAFIYVVWSLIYFLVHFVENYKREEIKNLRWEASKNEFELNLLKSQLNPHFIFNSMNSIRALIDENPNKSKEAINQLSSILRTTLQMSKKKVITLEEELNLVRDYLSLEATRYEERLRVEMDVDLNLNKVLVPPLMLQTLIENGIKHGISKTLEGGRIRLETFEKDKCACVVIINGGQYFPNGSSNSGFGLKNTIQRLRLLYGDNATFNIENLNSKEVVVTILIPMIYESSDN